MRANPSDRFPRSGRKRDLPHPSRLEKRNVFSRARLRARVGFPVLGLKLLNPSGSPWRPRWTMTHPLHPYQTAFGHPCGRGRMGTKRSVSDFPDMTKGNETVSSIGAELGIATSAASTTLQEFRGKSRVLVVFEELSRGKAEIQEYLLADKFSALRNHNVILIRVAAHGVFESLYPREDLSADAIRAELGGHEAEKFEAVLLGLDGVVQLRSSQPVAVSYLCQLIEKMPEADGH